MEIDIEKLKADTEKSLSSSKKILVFLFISGVCILTILIISAPEVSANDKKIFMTFPRSASQIQDLSISILNYTQTSYWYVVSLFCFLYLLLQSFAIPGPLILSILAGALFGRWEGLFYVSCCATCGASLCYMLSNFFGKGLIIRKYPGQVVEANKRIQDHKDNLFFYLLFLRLTPIAPNWLINISSPIMGVPFWMFFLATFLGLMPANCIHINAGMTLATIEQVGLNTESLLMLVGLACLALVPTFFMNRSKEKKFID